MRRFACLAFALVACTGVDLPTPNPSGGGGGGEIVCNADEKVCGDACVARDDPAFGCADACEPCFDNSVASCVDGECTFEMCAAGFSDCDGDVGNGCEVDLLNDPANCNACGNGCTLADATPGCADGACTVDTCSDGFGDCDGVAANGCEAVLATDGEHCGSCGRNCFGGDCSDSACGPVTLATSQGNMGTLTDDGANLYWAADGFIIKQAIKDALPPAEFETLATIVGTTFMREHNGELYFVTADQTQIWRVPTDDMLSAAVIATGQSCVGGLAVYGSDLYWNEIGDSALITGCTATTVKKRPLAGGAIDTVVSVPEAQIFDIAAGVDGVYWPESLGQWRVRRVTASNMVEDVFSLVDVMQIEVSDSFVFAKTDLATPHTLESFDLANPSTSPPMQLANGINDAIIDFRVDDTHIYLATAFGLKRMPLAGGAIQTVVAGPPTRGVTLLDDRVIWTDTGDGGSVRSIAK